MIWVVGLKTIGGLGRPGDSRVTESGPGDQIATLPHPRQMVRNAKGQRHDRQNGVEAAIGHMQ